MTLLSIERKAINLEQITYLEETSWQESQPDGKIASYNGIKVYFVGGTTLRLIGAEAAQLRTKLQAA